MLLQAYAACKQKHLSVKKKSAISMQTWHLDKPDASLLPTDCVPKAEQDRNSGATTPAGPQVHIT